VTTTSETRSPALLRSELRSLELTERKLSDILAQRGRENRIRSLYPASGPLRRALYPKHLAFFKCGSEAMERAAIAANRVGKTWGIGGYESALHLTGEYPDWWNGRRFDHSVDWWAAGDTGETTRDIVQLALLGPIGEFGTGLIPKSCIVGDPTHRSGVSGSIDTVRVKHVSGGVSHLGFKSYDQGRKKFQGTAKHGIWLDEEPPAPVYDECLLRLLTTNGLMICTFTPMEGLSEVALRFLPHLAPEPDEKLHADHMG